jgi:hypothetical protein
MPSWLPVVLQGLFMPSVADFVLQSFLLFAPALVAVTGGFAAFRLCKSKSKRRGITFVTAAALLAIGAGLGRIGSHSLMWGAPALIGSVILLHLTATSPTAFWLAKQLSFFASIKGSPVKMSYLLLAMCPLFVLGGLWQIDVMAAPEPMNLEGLQEFQAVDLEEMTTISTYTDRGQRIPLFKANERSAESINITGNQGLPVLETPLPYRAIRLTNASVVTNCTGWVFAGAHGWIQCRDVQTILDDNGYQPVKSVRPSDLAVYRDNCNTITHTGYVIALLDDGRPILQSKWGHQGVFLHLPEGTPYGNNWTFYHSTRPNHLLASSPSEQSNSRVSGEAAP